MKFLHLLILLPLAGGLIAAEADKPTAIGPPPPKSASTDAAKKTDDEQKAEAKKKADAQKKKKEEEKPPDITDIKDRAKAKDQTKNTDPWSFDRRIQPILRKFCYDCHNDVKTKGDVNLQRDENPTLIANNRKMWNTALQMVRDGEMPPEKAKQPSTEERQRLAEFIDLTLNTLDCATVKDPGRPAARRLNRIEYDASIRALFGLDLTPGQQFSPDGSSYGFDTIADALTMSPVQVEQYYDAAAKVLDVVWRDDAAMKRVFIAEPGKDLSARDAARRVITHFTTRAYRKPAEAKHLDQLMTLFDAASAGKKAFTAAVRPMLHATLISTRFLMRVEDSVADAQGAYPVSSYDLASRLSFLLWSAPPDDALMDLAAADRLKDPAVIEAQAKRLLADPRSRALVENFAGQWLQLRSLDDHKPDQKTFPQFNDALRTAMREEAYLVLLEVFRNDRPLTELLAADFTYLNEDLARHYGISGVSGPQMRRVTLSDPRRGGLVTSAAVLTITADPGRTNIPRRGNYVLGTILGTPPPPPPPNVPQLEETKSDGAPQTLRKRLEIHRTNPECAACHAKMDPLGFALENYDAIGRWREQQDGVAIDASGKLPNGEIFTGAVEMKQVLLARKAAFARTMTESLLIYALGRGLQHSDECVVQDALKALEQNGYRFSALLTTIVRSFPFTHRRNADW